jgi:hypothetical protein
MACRASLVEIGLMLNWGYSLTWYFFPQLRTYITDRRHNFFSQSFPGNGIGQQILEK